MNYYQRRDFISNSDLSAFKKEYYGIEPLPNLDYIYAFGNLADAVILEPHKVDYISNVVPDVNWSFTNDDMMQAAKMKEAFDKDSAASFMFKTMRKQYAFYRNAFKINYQGFEFVVKAKCKFDGIVKNVLGADLKTTACTTERAFLDSFPFFDYDRQAAWYMDLAGINRMIYVGISKKNYKVFKIAIDRNGYLYKQGRAKYEKLAFQYHHLINIFNIAA